MDILSVPVLPSFLSNENCSSAREGYCRSDSLNSFLAWDFLFLVLERLLKQACGNSRCLWAYCGVLTGGKKEKIKHLLQFNREIVKANEVR